MQRFTNSGLEKISEFIRLFNLVAMKHLLYWTFASLYRSIPYCVSYQLGDKRHNTYHSGAGSTRGYQKLSCLVMLKYLQ